MASSSRSAIRDSIRRSAATSASAHRRSMIVTPGSMVRGRPALLDKAPCQIVIGTGTLGRILQPTLQVARPSPRKHPVAILLSERRQMFMAGLFTGRVTGQIIRLQANLRGQKARNCQRDDFTGCQQTTRISERTVAEQSRNGCVDGVGRG